MAIIQSIIPSGLEAVEMRNRMESKGALEVKGSLYVGTGGKTTVIKSDKSKVLIPETTAFNPPDTTDKNANGGVMIWDTSMNSDTGWTVAKIKTKNLENGRVEQANKANRADTILSNGEYKSFADAFVQMCLLKIYPVGSIYMSVDPRNPHEFIGGTWVEWGKGRVPVGVDDSDTDFKTPGKEGGEKTHDLSVSEMPSHSHEGTYTSPKSDTTGKPDDNGEYSDTKYSVHYDVTQGGMRYVETSSGMITTIPLNNVIESIHGVYPNGGSQAHNNLQPYITCYMWKRTA